MQRVIVICRADRTPEGAKGEYELATRKEFTTWKAAYEYAKGISTSREPKVFAQLLNTPEPQACVVCGDELEIPRIHTDTCSNYCADILVRRSE